MSYGGISGGLRAVQQLRNIFPELRAMTVRDPDKVKRAAAALLEELTWWGHTLRQARNDRPHAA